MEAADKQSLLQQIRGSPTAKVIDKAIEATEKFLGPSGKAWLANGLDELAQVFTPGVEQIQPGNNPGLWGRPTTGEATAERMDGESKETLAKTYDVPEKDQEKDQGRER
jgi:hypothetical protein